MQTPQNLKGFRDFLPSEKRKRDFVAAKVKQTFELFGFEPIETPTLEYADLLLGKYGAEADKLVYTFEDRGDRRIGLRYDQTVPTARILIQYQNELPRYLRRYQIQNVFRADKPQKGRFREFTQCDIDIFGSTSPLADAEVIACTYFAYKNVGFNQVQLNLNDRQVLVGTLSPFATPEVSTLSIIQTIDKLDKISVEEAVAELVSKGLAESQAKAAISEIEKADMSENLSQIVDKATNLGVPPGALVFNPKIARGLDYYTGMIFEVTIPEYGSGSLGGGGRYDQLIQQLGGPSVPAVGIAFGFDRMVEAASDLGLIPTDKTGTQVLITIFDEATEATALATAEQLRAAGVPTEVYPALDKLGKQFQLADRKAIPYVIIIGEAEIAANKVTLKNMQTGDQSLLTIDEVTNTLGQ